MEKELKKNIVESIKIFKLGAINGNKNCIEILRNMSKEYSEIILELFLEESIKNIKITNNIYL